MKDVELSDLRLDEVILLLELTDQVVADGVVEAEVDVAAFVDLHLLHADVVQDVGERDEEDGRLDGHVLEALLQLLSGLEEPSQHQLEPGGWLFRAVEHHFEVYV